MKEIPSSYAGMADEVLSNHSKICSQQKIASASYYGFKAREGFNIPFLTPRQLATQLGISVKTLERMRKDGSGPPFKKIGKKHIRYSVVELDEWWAANNVQYDSK